MTQAWSSRAHVDELIILLQNEMINSVDTFYEELVGAALKDVCIFFCGNGGSSATASHLENDLSIGLWKSSSLKLRTQVLGSNASLLTAIANDFSYRDVFSRELFLKGKQGDLLVVVSGSGNSENVIQVVTNAKAQGIRTLGITAFGGGAVSNALDVSIKFNTYDMQIFEDLSLVLGHMVMRKLSDVYKKGEM